MGFVNIQNTNFENGVINRNAANLFGSMEQLDPTRYHTYWEDFDYFLAADWTITGAGAGTQALADGDGGLLRLTTAGADNDAELLQKVGEGFTVEAVQNRKMYFRTRLQVDDATESDIGVGLADAPPVPAPTNGILFVKDDDDAELDILVRSGGATVASATNIATVVTSTFFTAEWYWDGIDRVYYGVDGTPLGFLDLSGLSLPVGELAPTFGVQAGQASALVGDFDYLMAAKQRD